MNKWQRETAVPTSGQEAEVRAINAKPWEPLPGMVKLQCPVCRYFFAAPAHSPELRCQDCADKLPRGSQW